MFRFVFFVRSIKLLVMIGLISFTAIIVAGQTQADPAASTVGPGDELEITVLGYPELTTKTIVMPDGYLSFPLIGRLKAGGYNIQDLTRSLQTALNASIYEPQVTINMVHMRSQHFSVLGEVKKTGVFPLTDAGLTLYEAIAQAEGFVPGARVEEVRIIRKDNTGQKTTINVDMSDLSSGNINMVDLTIKPGDMVYIPGQSAKRQVSVIGKVANPGRYNFTPGMTVIDVLSSAGWVTREGVASSVILVRRQFGQNEYSRINAQEAVSKRDLKQDVVLTPGDIIYVPETFISKMSTFGGLFSSTIEPVAHSYLRVYDTINPANVIVDR